MNKRTLLFLAPAVAAALFALRAQRQPPAVPIPADARVLLLRFGLTDRDERLWKGSLEADSGQVLSVKGYGFQRTDKLNGNQFEFSTRPWMPASASVDLSPSRQGPLRVFPAGL